MNEQLSAFLDNEATRDEADSVVNALLRDEALRDSWTRQHWIRTTLRSHSAEPAVDVDTGFANRVMSAIAADEHRETAVPNSNVLPMTPRGRRTRTRRWRGVAGMAAAASVAGVVLLAGNPFVRTGTSGSEGRIATAENNPTSTRRVADSQQVRQGFGSGGWNNQLADFSSVQAQPAGVRTVAAAGMSAQGAASMGGSDASADHWSVSDPAVRDELNGYLVDHNGMARGYGMSSTTPALVRVAAYGQDVTQ
ncbi:sigma-E factor negative regulatory protein [Salinisphaera hydrothermalis]|uniref:sigma-E factor negative regulatory protein n=1 Tax=Salinisphaera hydrothermalis TaxID=563188 RepID=UPI0033423BFD